MPTPGQIENPKKEGAEAFEVWRDDLCMGPGLQHGPVVTKTEANPVGQVLHLMAFQRLDAGKPALPTGTEPDPAWRTAGGCPQTMAHAVHHRPTARGPSL